MGTTIVDVQDVSKRFTLHRDTSLKERVLAVGHHGRPSTEDFWALRNVNLSIDAGSTIGLIGANGSGKSTLLKVIGGIIQPTTGTVRRRGRLAALLELGAGFHQDLTGRENVYLNASILGMSRAETAGCFDEIVDFSGIEAFIDTPVKFYSSGMYVRLAFAVSVHVDPDLLLVDEVLAVGDEPFQRKCMDKIRTFQSEGRTIVLVSHSAEQVGELCDRAVLLHHGDVAVDGPPQTAIRALRAGFDADQALEDEGHHRGEPAARIDRVELLTPAGEPSTAINTGGSVLVRAHITPHARLTGWFAAVAIETPLGQTLFRFTSQTAGMVMPDLGRPGHVDFLLPSVPLAEGRYSVNVGIGDAVGNTIHRLAPAASLVVHGPHMGTGVLGIEPTITVA